MTRRRRWRGTSICIASGGSSPRWRHRSEGVDALVFTGGVGERSSEIRTAAAHGLRFLGVAVDPALDAAARPDADVSAPLATVRTLVIEAREDVEMARQTRAVLAASDLSGRNRRR